MPPPIRMIDRILQIEANILALQSGGGGASSWGDITGTLADQADLQTALNAKINSSKITIGATAPVSPSTGDIWVDTN